MNLLEIIGTAVGLVYLYLEYRASAWLWVASIAMPAIYLVVYYRAGLYADFAISIYYITLLFPLLPQLFSNQASALLTPALLTPLCYSLLR